MINMDRFNGAYEVDCVVNFWALARYMGYMNGEKEPKELFYKLFPDWEYDEENVHGYGVINCLEVLTTGDDETREVWEDVRFYLNDSGYRFYEQVMFVF